MDEIFGSTGFAAEDNELKARIERDIGLLALVGAESAHSEEEKPEKGMQEDIADPKSV